MTFDKGTGPKWQYWRMEFVALAIAVIIALLVALPRFRSADPAKESQNPGQTQQDDSSQNPSASASPGDAPAATPQDPNWTGSPEAGSKLKVLNEILASKNDNDPRMDRDLRELSPEARAAFRSRYASLPLEERNARGLIVFLLGRDLSDSKDVAFLTEVLNEPPCLSLRRCTEAETAPQDPHHSSEDQVTRAYPQLVALRMIERRLEAQGESTSAKAQELARFKPLLDQALKSGMPPVADRAYYIVKRFTNPK